MQAKELFDDLIQSHFSRWLQSIGFRSQPSPSSPGISFFRQTGSKPTSGVSQIIDFQVGGKSSPNTCFFTVNFGIHSDTITRFEKGNLPGPWTVPAIIDWQWRERIGFLMPDQFDLWWALNTARKTMVEAWEGSLIPRNAPVWNDLTAFSEYLRRAIETYGLPFLERHGSDEALRDAWMAGQRDGLSEFLRLKFLSILLWEIGPRKELDRVLGELQSESHGQPWEANANRHIAKLRDQMVGGAVGR